MDGPPPGWYDDPAVAGGLRYWDGTSWTDQTRPSPAGSTQPRSSVPGEVAAGREPPRESAGDGRGRRGPLLAGIAAVVVVGFVMAAIVLFGGFGQSDDTPELAVDDPVAEDEPAPDADEPEPSGPQQESEEPELEDDIGPPAPQGPFAESGTVTILHAFTGEADVAGLRAMLEEFVREYPDIEVLEEGTGDFESLARTRIGAGNPPDIVLHPQPPLLQEFWQQGVARPLGHAVDASALRAQVVGGLTDTVTFDGELVGLPVRVAPKSLVWYSPRTFDAGGYEIPETWDELLSLSRRMADDDVVEAPWCIGIESADATGWVATDWIEDVVLRAEGPRAYDAWTAGDLPFSSDEVRGAIERYIEPIWFDDDLVLEGRDGIATTSFFESSQPLTDGSMGCGLHRQASFLRGFFDGAQRFGVDYDFFVLPSIDPEQGAPVVVAGDTAALYTDNDAANTLLAWLAQPQAGEAWAATSGFVSPFGDRFNAAAYRDEPDRRAHDIISDASTLRFDASDQMPREVGAGAFWVEMTDWVAGVTDLGDALAEIDRAFASAR